MTRKEQLKADLLKNFSDFQGIKYPGGSKEANEIVASGLAESIDRAIDDGVEFRFQGVFAVKDINAIQEKAPGYLYTCSDSGILKAKTELPVVKNTVVLWNGEDFKTFLVIPEATGSPVQISVDSFLSTFSGNPVQNKVVTTAINALSEALASEAAARASADTALGERIDAEATARENADATLQGNIDAEETAREDADATLQSNIESEATEREQADGELQAQIDAISSRSDVVDVVASHVELVAYDTSTLADNDVIKVLADETHDDAIAYYRWSTTTEAWSFVGSQGPYYTISETDTLLAGRAPTNHASTATTYGVGSATKYGHVKVDEALSSSSTNPVQNKAVKAAIDAKTDVKYFMYNAPYADIIAALPSAYQNRKNVFLIGNENGEYPCVYSLLHVDRDNSAIVFVAVDSEYNIKTIKKSALMGSGWSSATYSVAPKAHASSATTYGTGTSSNYGHVKLSSDTNSTSGVNDGVAAAPSAVKSAYDLAQTALDSIPTFGNSWVVHKYFNTATYALRITIPYSVRTAGTSFLVMTSCNNGHKSLFSIHFWKNANTAITNISVKHIYGDKDTDVANKVYYEPGSSAYDAHVYIASNSSSDFSTSFAILCNSQEMTRNTSNITFDTVNRSLPIDAAIVVADKSYVEPSYAHTDEINFNNVPSGSGKNHWFNYRNGDTDASDRSNTVGMYVFGNRNGTVNDVKLFANALRLGMGDASSSNTKYGEFSFDSNSGGSSPRLFLYGASNPRFGVFVSPNTSGAGARGVQLDASPRGSEYVGLWAYSGTASGWLVYVDDSNIASLGKSSDTVVRLGSKKLDFSGTLGSGADVIYFV